MVWMMISIKGNNFVRETTRAEELSDRWKSGRLLFVGLYYQLKKKNKTIGKLIAAALISCLFVCLFVF